MAEFKKPTKIYSAVINGYSVGVTFSQSTAEAWISRSSATDKRVREMAYTEPTGLNYPISYGS